MDFLVVGWVSIIAFCIIMYVILDGFTLGTGLIMPFIQDEKERSVLFSALLPTWDGNQTWLVLGTASLYGAFPLAFSFILPTLYLPLMVMLMALLFRGIVFEFRLKAHGKVIRRWDRLFIIGSYVATFIQGVVLGSFVRGFTGTIVNHSIPAYHWLSPFSLFTGFGLLFGYSLLGSTRMLLKTEGTLQDKLFTLAKILLICVGVLMLVATLWTPFLDPHIKQKWFASGNTGTLIILPLVTIAAWFWALIALSNKKESAPYWLTIGIFICGYAGFGYSLWPYIVPHVYTIWQAAADRHSLGFIMVGACIMIPVLLVYTWFSYRIFRGKVKDVIHY
jgi:cytochrome bd ubiquinol oxidase subunit II